MTLDIERTLKELIAIESVSSDDPALAKDTRAASDYVESKLKALGATIFKGDDFEYPEGFIRMANRPMTSSLKNPNSLAWHFQAI